MTLFMQTSEGERVLLGEIEGAEEAEEPLARKLLDDFWDSRLDGTDCFPVFMTEDIDPCECEESGYWCSGVPGILAHVENGKVVPGTEVEHCDLCARFDSDEAAYQELVRRGFVDESVPAEGEMEQINISIETTNAAFGGSGELARILRGLASSAEHGLLNRDRAIRDSNGNIVGKVKVCGTEDTVHSTTEKSANHEYQVRWVLDVEAASPREAVEQALAIQRDPESTAVVFEVALATGGPFVIIDLMREGGCTP